MDMDMEMTNKMVNKITNKNIVYLVFFEIYLISVKYKLFK